MGWWGEWFGRFSHDIQVDEAGEWVREVGQRAESLAGRMAPPEELSLSGLMSGHKKICGVCEQCSAPSAALMRVLVMTWRMGMGR